MSASKPVARFWTSQEESKFRAMLEAGKTASEIAVELNRTRLAIYARLQQLDRKRARVARLLENRLKAEAK